MSDQNKTMPEWFTNQVLPFLPVFKEFLPDGDFVADTPHAFPATSFRDISYVVTVFGSSTKTSLVNRFYEKDGAVWIDGGISPEGVDKQQTPLNADELRAMFEHQVTNMVLDTLNQ